jgi:hypothetical protein
MLQIISGKFFGDGKIEEQETDAILYSNYGAIGPIKTAIFELRPVDSTDAKIFSYVLRFNNRYERSSYEDRFVMPAADEVVEQFRLLASFYFQSYFHVNRNSVERLCRVQPTYNSERAVPKSLVPRFFDLAKTGTQEEAGGFVSFLEKVISLPRNSYRLLITCLTGFFGALESMEENFDLAYSRMVFMLEALRRSNDLPNPSWDDYDPSLRGKLDEQLTGMDPASAEKIRGVLLSNPHLRLKKRFVNYISGQVNDTFFTTEAEGLNTAVARSEFSRTVGNLYDARSGYVREFRRAREQLRLPTVGANTDIFRSNNDPHFTFAGVVRLACHVLRNYVHRQPTVERENIDWRRQLPSLIEVGPAVERSLASAHNFEPGQARLRFNAFVQQLLTSFAATGHFRPLDIRPLMEPLESMIPTAREDRIPMLALYWMFNGMIPAEHQRPGWEAFINQWEAESQTCSIEFMTMLVLWASPLQWSAEECTRIFDQYQNIRYKEGATLLPRLVEIAIMGEIAGKFLDVGHIQDFRAWLDRAIFDASGKKELQDYLSDQQKLRQRTDSRFILRSAAGYKPVPVEEKRPAPVTDEEIRICAYRRWEAAGKPENTGDRFWQEAQAELVGRN